ncbi:hypothetical protein, partial [Streptomyces diastatochromogenes]|uniref:hypothetical protein n=1 Tax=Streptomyces diastatochromogenes TaxID=42236 RepID=UPI001ABF8DD2
VAKQLTDLRVIINDQQVVKRGHGQSIRKLKTQEIAESSSSDTRKCNGMLWETIITHQRYKARAWQAESLFRLPNLNESNC